MADLKKILVAVTGMSPQIVTETLYALHTQHQWLPEEIHVLTTQTGAENIIGSLLGENGFFRRLCAEYALPAIRFDTDCIHVIQGETGEPLADIRSPGKTIWRPIRLYVLFMICVPMSKPNCTCRLPVAASRWGFISAMRCRCSGGGKTGSHTYWWRRPSSKTVNFSTRPNIAHR